MTTKKHQSILEAIKNQTEKNIQTQESAHNALKRMGIIDKNGDYTKNYTKNPEFYKKEN